MTDTTQPDDEWCQCGYRQSAHGTVPHACGSFKRSQMFNDSRLTADWARAQKKLARR